MITYDETTAYGHDVMDLITLCVRLLQPRLTAEEIVDRLRSVSTFAIELIQSVTREPSDSDYFRGI